MRVTEGSAQQALSSRRPYFPCVENLFGKESVDFTVLACDCKALGQVCLDLKSQDE